MGIEHVLFNDDARSAIAKINKGLDACLDSLRPHVRFLHISDPHGASTAVTRCNELMAADDSIQFVLGTGDFTSYGGSLSSSLKNALDSIPEGKLLMVAGNHDVYDNSWGSSISQTATTNWLKGYTTDVVWGDGNGVASYWYKDINLGRNKLRLIGLDQYEIDVVRKPSDYHTVYSQAQVDWFIARIKELSISDYLVIMMHEPPVQSRTTPDQYAVGMRPVDNNDMERLFVTSGLTDYANRRDEPSRHLFPRIMDAYLNRKSLSMTYNNLNGNSSSPDVTINEDFRLTLPCNFLFYVGGHTHCDNCGYLPNEENETQGGDWSKQLMLYITAADRSVSYASWDDLGGTGTQLGTPASPSSESYRINLVDIDFASQTIYIERIGDKNTVSGRVRTKNVFPFKK